MPFPDLELRPDARVSPTARSTIWAEAVGVPDNGNNTFLLPFVDTGTDPQNVDEDWLWIGYEFLGPSVTSVSFVSLSADKRMLTLNFAQSGADQARITVANIHSMVS